MSRTHCFPLSELTSSHAQGIRIRGLSHINVEKVQSLLHVQARSQKFAACFYAIILLWVVLKIKVGKIWKLHENSFPMSTKTLWFYPETTEKIAIQDKNPTSKIVKIFNRTGLVILVIGLLNSDAIFSVISGWNQEVIVYYGKLFSCSFQISPYFYF